MGVTDRNSEPDWSTRQSESLLRYAERDGFLRAELRLLPRSAGGRRHPVYSGWVAAWNLGGERDGHRPDSNAAVVIPGGKLSPGESAQVQIFPVGFAWNDVKPPQTVELLDSDRIIGVGVIHERVEGTENMPGRWPCYSVVRLREQVEGAEAGSVGTILAVYEDAYEVEIEGDDGGPVYLGAIADHDLELLEPYNS